MIKKKLNDRSKKEITREEAQSTMEFAFSMMVILLLMFGAVQILRWTGLSLVERRQRHDEFLKVPVTEAYTDFNLGPAKQLDPNFYKSNRMKAVWGEP